LDIIKKKVDKETDSSRSKDHRSHAKKEEYISVVIHHHHSPRHSVKRAEISLSLSPIRKHWRSSGVDELQEDFKKIKPPNFNGDNKKYEDLYPCLLGMRNYFQFHNYSSQGEGRIAIYQLKGKTSMWWDQFVQENHIDEKRITWR
jgi:hypothetical protein